MGDGEDEGSRDVPQCLVCGELSTKSALRNETLPICNNVVCYYTTIDEVNKTLREIKNEESEV